MSLANIKTFGTLIGLLKGDLHKVTDKIYTLYFGTPEYIVKQTLFLHRAFSKFADECNVISENKAEFLQRIKEHVEYYKNSNSDLNVLFYTLPDEFNVRGKWTPEELN